VRVVLVLVSLSRVNIGRKDTTAFEVRQERESGDYPHLLHLPSQGKKQNISHEFHKFSRLGFKNPCELEKSIRIGKIHRGLKELAELPDEPICDPAIRKPGSRRKRCDEQHKDIDTQFWMC
jgi:hypothetical protein